MKYVVVTKVTLKLEKVCKHQLDSTMFIRSVFNGYNIIYVTKYHLHHYKIVECKDIKGSEKCERIKNKGWCTHIRYAARATKNCMKTCNRCKRQPPINRPPRKKIAGRFTDNLVSISLEFYVHKMF